ncbi:MAG TPA: phosphate signaling complex protein PhoU [Solirubrobacteraceae bacterium]|jgi:phosphate transport system protein
MASAPEPGHPVAGDLRPTFHQELVGLEEQALGALDIASEQLDNALGALARHDLGLARLVIADDDRVDGRYLETHQAILSLLARQTPVAGDLRLVAALLHLIMHVERIGDQCVNIAKLIVLSGPDAPLQGELLEKLARMGAIAAALVAQCKTAFRDRDLELATEMLDKAADVAKLNRDIFRSALELGEDTESREWATYMVLVARALERIADNAIDIGEQVAFVVTGLFQEFSDSPRPPVSAATEA